MSDYKKILTGMKRNELEAVAREFNKTYKIFGIGTKKKQDLILELLNNEKLLDEVFNRLYPKGEPIKDITKKSKRKVNKQNKKMISKSEEETLRTEIKKQLKEAMQEKSPSGKLKLLKSVQKLQQKLSRVEVKKKKLKNEIIEDNQNNSKKMDKQENDIEKMSEKEFKIKAELPRMFSIWKKKDLKKRFKTTNLTELKKKISKLLFDMGSKGYETKDYSRDFVLYFTNEHNKDLESLHKMLNK